MLTFADMSLYKLGFFFFMLGNGMYVKESLCLQIITI